MQSTIEQTNITAKPDFGNGRYSPLMESVFSDSQTVFGLDAKKAEKLARVIANHYGAHMANQPVKARISERISKDGKVTLSDAKVSVKGVTLTDALLCLRALQFAGDAGDFGFSFGETEWKLSSLEKGFGVKISAYLESL